MNEGSAPVDEPLILHTRVVAGAGGGPEKTILNSPRFLSKAGYASRCVYMRPPDDPGWERIEALAQRWNAPLMGIDDRGALDLTVPRRFGALLRDRPPAVWHGHDYKSNALGILLRNRFPMRLVTTVHGWVRHTRRTPIYYAIDRWALRFHDRVLCVSQDLMDRCRSVGVGEDRLRLVPNAIDLEEFRRSSTIQEAKRRLGLPTQGVLVAGVGRLSPEKGFDHLIRACDRLVREHAMDIHLRILGEGDDRRRLETLVRELGSGDRCSLVGHVPDTRPWFAAMDLFVLSSLREGLPNVLLEAMAMETPVVASRVAGTPSLIEDRGAGLLVEAGDTTALAEAIRNALSNEEVLKRWGAAGRLTVVERHSFEARMRTVVDVYDELLER